MDRPLKLDLWLSWSAKRNAFRLFRKFCQNIWLIPAECPEEDSKLSGFSCWSSKSRSGDRSNWVRAPLTADPGIDVTSRWAVEDKPGAASCVRWPCVSKFGTTTAWRSRSSYSSCNVLDTELPGLPIDTIGGLLPSSDDDIASGQRVDGAGDAFHVHLLAGASYQSLASVDVSLARFTVFFFVYSSLHTASQPLVHVWTSCRERQAARRFDSLSARARGRRAI